MDEMEEDDDEDPVGVPDPLLPLDFPKDDGGETLGSDVGDFLGTILLFA